MNTFLLSFDANTSFSGGNAPILEILVGGITVATVTMSSGATSYDLFVPYTGTAPSSLSFQFDGSSGDPGDTITFTAVSINANVLNVGTDLSMSSLTQSQSSTVTATNTLFGHVTPTLGAPTITGTAGDDSLVGTTGDDVISGLGGADFIVAMDGADEIDGGADNDLIFAQDGDDTVLGGDGDDVLYGEIGNDVLYGEANNDTIIGGAGDDIINGGTGNDGLVGDAGDDTIYGEDGDDFLVGDAGDDILIGDAGNDILVGGDNDDALSGGDDDDQLIGGSGDDLLDGGDGADELIGEAGSDVLTGGAGDDDLFGGDDSDIIDGGDDSDNISGGGGADTLDGGDGADSIIGGAGADIINGGDGNDIIHGHGLDAVTISDILFNNPNVIYSQETGSFYQFVDTSVSWSAAITAAQGTTLNGVSGHLVTITSDAENEVIYQLGVANGADNSTGGSANRIWLAATDIDVDQDWVWADGIESGIQFSQASTATNNFYNNWGSGQPNNSGGAQTRATIWFNGGVDDDRWDDRNDSDGHDYVIEWEGGLFSDDNAIDTIDGGDGNDWIYGWDGADLLDGGAGVDVIFGGDGADTINGEDDSDTLVGGAGADIIDGGAADDFIMIADGDFAAGESLTGDAGTDSIVLTNATTVDFRVGTLATIETLSGSGQDDTVTMSTAQYIGFSTIDLEAGTDVLNIFTSGSENATGFTFPTVSNVEEGNLIGDTGNDDLTITGAQLDTVIIGTGTIDFGAGTDSLNITSTSADLNTLGATDGSISNLETISASLAGAGVTIDMSGQTEAFTIIGSGNDDTLAGGTGADIIDAGVGNDTINLANGSFATGESLTGNTGTDEIVLTNATTVDFTTGTIATIELLTGSAGDDDVTYAIEQALDFTTIDLGGGTDNSRVNITGTVDVTALGTPTVNNAENGFLTGSTGNDDLTITGAQLNTLVFGAGIIDFDAGTDIINLDGTSTTLNTLGLTDASILGLEEISFAASAAVVTLNLSGQTEGFTITGSDAAGLDNITLGSGDDTVNAGDGGDFVNGIAGGNNTINMEDGDDFVVGGSGIDIINGGMGDDTIFLLNGDFVAGESLTGDAGTDAISLFGGVTVDFTVGTISTVESLVGDANDDDVTYTIQQALDFTSIDLGGGTDTSRVQINGTVDVTALGTPTVSNVENGFLIGSTGNDELTITGAQLDALVFGSGIIDFDAGTDSLNLTSTSADLNTLGATDGSILNLENISAASAAASVTITLSGQTEDFTVTGSANADTLTTGSGADTINAGAGSDIITGGAGADIIDGGADDDTINLANGDFAAGESLTGDAGTDGIVLTNATTVDFTTGTIATIETIDGSSGDDDVRVGADQLIGMSTVALNGGTDILDVFVNGAIDVSAAVFPTSITAETKNLTGSTNNDTFTVTGAQLNTILLSTSSIIDFDAGTDTLSLTTTSSDFNTRGTTDGVILNLENVDTLNSTADITVNLSGQTEGFTFTGGGFIDTITTGSGADTITTGAGADIITGGAGVDIIDGGADDDTINLANGDFAAGESLTGDAGTDEIILTNATTVDFQTGTIATIELLTGSALDDNVTISASQFANFTTIDLAGGTDVLNVFADNSDISGLGLPTVSNVEEGNLIGDGANNSVTLTGGQLDAIISGAGIIDLGGGTGDTINLTSTSADLTTLSATDASIVGVETIDASAFGTSFVIDMSVQTEGFTLTGGTSDDTITGALGDDTINGGDGADILVGFEGDDTINGGDGNNIVFGGNGESVQTVDILSYGGVQDVGGTITQFIGGVTLDGNLWKKFLVDYTVTANTVIEFDFRSTTEGEIHGIGFDNDDVIDSNATFKVHGTQAWGLPNFDNYDGSGEWEHYAIDVGSFYTGTFSHLFIVNDDDASAVGVGSWANIVIYESGVVNDDDIINGGADDDQLLGGEGIDTLNGNAGNDILSGNAGDDILNGDAGDDILHGGDGADTLDGGANDDEIYGGAGIDTITGAAGIDIIDGGADADIIDGGADDDTINLSNGDFAAGESLTGSGGTDNITLTNATTVDFTTGTLATIETLNGSTGDDTVTMSASQYDDFTTIDLAGGTDALNIFADGSNITAATLATVSNTENGSLTGDGNDNSITLTGAQLDTILFGGGTIALGGGTADTINMTSTSADLNTLGATDGSITGLETISVSTAAAAVTIDLSGQTEDFTVTGGAFGDTLTTGSGDDTINSGSTIDASITSILSANPEAIVTTNGWIFHAYTATGASTFIAPTGVTQVDYLVVGGGGGGGGFVSGNTGGGGGGGAGEVDEIAAYSVIAGNSYAVVVGAGGAGGVGGTTFAGTGGTSSFDGNTALGGGGGGTNGVNNNGASGASGGGGRLTGVGAAGTDGNAGGDGSGATTATAAAGGGGGAGAAGADASGNNGGGGGDGVISNITGTDVYFGGGGGGGAYIGSGTGGTGGAGGGGTAPNTRAAGIDGLEGRGSGGSGATGSNGVGAFDGGDGGDGMVIVAYQVTAPEITRLAGGQGNDELYGSAGQDIFEFSDTGAANEDTIFNFNAQIDKLDLSDLLTGYDPTTEIITDFVQITDSGSDSEVRVDTTGSASFGATTVVATIDGVTGLTDEADLEAFSVLIIA